MTSLLKVMRIAQNGEKNNLSVVKTRGRSSEPRWRKNNQLVLVSEKNGAHSVLDKNAVDLLWRCRRNWKLVVNSILLFHCVNARCFIDKSVIPLAPSNFAIDIV